jgi:hypothetical protein
MDGSDDDDSGDDNNENNDKDDDDNECPQSIEYKNVRREHGS